MNQIKFLIFLEITTIIVCIIFHIISILTKTDFPLKSYIIMMLIVFLAFLFSLYVLDPLHEFIKQIK